MKHNQWILISMVLRLNCSVCGVRLILELWFVFLGKLVLTCRVIVCVASGCHLRSLLRTLLLLFMNLATFHRSIT